MQYVSLALSIITGIIYVLTFFYSRNDIIKWDVINNSIELSNISSEEENEETKE